MQLNIYIYGVTSLCCGPIQFSRLSPGSLGKNDKNMFFFIVLLFLIKCSFNINKL